MYKLFLPQLTFPSSLKYSITNKNFAKLYQQIAWPYITYHDSPWISIIKRFKIICLQIDKYIKFYLDTLLQFFVRFQSPIEISHSQVLL